MKWPWPSVHAEGVTLFGGAGPIPVTKAGLRPKYVLLTILSTGFTPLSVRLFQTGDPQTDPATSGFLVVPSAPTIVHSAGVDQISVAGTGFLQVNPVEDRDLPYAEAIYAPAENVALSPSTPVDLPIPLTQGGKPPNFVRIAHAEETGVLQVALGSLADGVDPTKGPIVRTYEPLTLNCAGAQTLSLEANAAMTANIVPLENSGRRHQSSRAAY